MKLYFAPTSPFVRKVNVLRHELGKTDEIALEEVATTPFNSVQSLAASNPLAKIPALERPDGSTLYDSRVITRYLDSLYAGGLYPEGSRLWETLTLEATGDGLMESTVAMAYELRLRPEGERSADWIEAQWAKASRAISALNSRWMSHLHGPLDMGQISVACALSYIDFRHGAREWRKGNDALAAWHEKFESRASMQATVIPDA